MQITILTNMYIRYHYRREEPEVVSRSGTGGVVQVLAV